MMAAEFSARVPGSDENRPHRLLRLAILSYAREDPSYVPALHVYSCQFWTSHRPLYDDGGRTEFADWHHRERYPWPSANISPFSRPIAIHHGTRLSRSQKPSSMDGNMLKRSHTRSPSAMLSISGRFVGCLVVEVSVPFRWSRMIMLKTSHAIAQIRRERGVQYQCKNDPACGLLPP